MMFKNLSIDKMDNETWVTADQRAIKVVDMTDKHLHRAVAWLRRKEFKLRIMTLKPYSGYIADAPDGASASAESEVNHIIEQSADEFLAWLIPPYKLMLQEIVRRLR